MLCAENKTGKQLRTSSQSSRRHIKCMLLLLPTNWETPQRAWLFAPNNNDDKNSNNGNKPQALLCKEKVEKPFVRTESKTFNFRFWGWKQFLVRKKWMRRNKKFSPHALNGIRKPTGQSWKVLSPTESYCCNEIDARNIKLRCHSP